jgi:hypothetical protein
MGLLKEVAFVLKERCLTPNKMVAAFVRTGQLKQGANHLKGECTTDWDMLMSRTYCQSSQEDMNHMSSAKNAVKRDMRLNGKTTTVFLDQLNIPTNEYDVDRDNLTLSRQDIQTLNHTESLRRQRARDLASDPAMIALAEERSDARKLLERTEAKAAKALAAAQKKETKKRQLEEEKNLPPELRKEAVAARKAEAERRKLARKVLSDQKQADEDAKVACK